MFRYVKLSGIILLFVLFLSTPGFSQTQTEQLVITTYYPSPYGSYRQLKIDDPNTTAGRRALDVSQTGAVGGTGYAVYASKTGASTTNVGGYFEASGGTNNYGIQIPSPAAGANNYAIYSNSAAQSYFAGDLSCNRIYTTAATQAHGTGHNFTDIAENIQAEDAEAGDVVIIDPDNNVKVVKSTKAYDTSVAGIISETPAFYIAKNDKKGYLPLALAGRVPCKVTAEGGSINRGDLLVTSSKPGYAMKGNPKKIRIGSVLGKALEPLEKGEGKVTVLVTLQ